MHRAAVHSIKNIPSGQRIFIAECLEKKYMGGGVSSFTFRAKLDSTSNESFKFYPGQWVDMFIPDVDVVGGFSMTSIPSQLPYFSLAVKDADHPPTSWLTRKCKVGDLISIRSGGDYFWTLGYSMPAPEVSKTAEDGILLVAGGIGINPLYSIISEVTSCLENSTLSKPIPKCAILYTAKDNESLIFSDSICSYAEKHPDNLHACLKTTGTNTGKSANSTIGVGRLNEVDFKNAIKFLKSSSNEKSKNDHERSLNDDSKIISYLCGPPAFCDGYETLLHQLNVEDTRIERWW